MFDIIKKERMCGHPLLHRPHKKRLGLVKYLYINNRTEPSRFPVIFVVEISNEPIKIYREIRRQKHDSNYFKRRHALHLLSCVNCPRRMKPNRSYATVRINDITNMPRCQSFSTEVVEECKFPSVLMEIIYKSHHTQWA